VNILSPPSRDDPAPDASDKAVILIVDDDATIRESLAAVFRSEKYRVRVAENGRVAVRRFLECSPNLILLDLNMPDVDGWKAFEVMARLAPYVPVIVITARPNQARRAAEAGVDMLLEKPLDIPTLLETVRKLLATPETSRFGQVLRTSRAKFRQ
jgi:DNA-binding response OmpR family regulator